MTAQSSDIWDEADAANEVDRLGYVYHLNGIAFRMYVARGEGADREIRFTAASPGHPEILLRAAEAA